MDQATNPFASPQSDISANPFGEALQSDAESVRHEYLKHEASVKSIALLYYLPALMFLLAGPALAYSAFVSPSDPSFSPGPQGLLSIGLIFLLGVVCILVGNGLRSLSPKIKIPAGIFSTIGLLGFPVGTIINGYILYLLFGRKGRMVLSEEYREIIRCTPHIQYKTSMVVKVLACILLAVLGFGVMGVFFLG